MPWRLDMKAKYHRVLLKMSGEALAGKAGRGIDFEFTARVCQAVKACMDMGVQVGIVCGGGNYWRGKKDGADNMVRTRADYMGMLATTMNGLALLDGLEKQGAPARLMSAMDMDKVAEPFNRDAAVRHLEEGKAVIFAGGTGEPYFTTDTAASLRALEIGADVLLLGKSVDGVYNADPAKDPAAVKYDRLSFAKMLADGLEAMDATATQLAMENDLPLHVFALEDPENILRAVSGEEIGTIIC